MTIERWWSIGDGSLGCGVRGVVSMKSCREGLIFRVEELVWGINGGSQILSLIIYVVSNTS